MWKNWSRRHLKFIVNDVMSSFGPRRFAPERYAVKSKSQGVNQKQVFRLFVTFSGPLLRCKLRITLLTKVDYLWDHYYISNRESHFCQRLIILRGDSNSVTWHFFPYFRPPPSPMWHFVCNVTFCVWRDILCVTWHFVCDVKYFLEKSHFRSLIWRPKPSQKELNLW